MAQFESHLPESLMRVGLTPRRALVGAVEKVAHRLGEVPQRLLLNGLRPGCQPVVFSAGRRQLSTLLAVTGRLTARLPMLLLLHGQIPHKPGMTTVLGQPCHLPRAGKQPKPTHTKNPRDDHRQPVERKGAALPVPAKAEGFHAAKTDEWPNRNKEKSQASLMEPTQAADRYLSCESIRPACPDNSARRVPTFFRRRPRGGHRA